MNNIEELKQQLAALFEKAEDKETIVAFTKLNETIDSIQEEHNKLESENRELLNDYKDMIKHTAIKATAQEVAVKSNPDLTFDEFLASYKSEK